MSEWSYRPVESPRFFWRGKWRKIDDVFLPGDAARSGPVTWDVKDNLRDNRRRHGQPSPPRPKYELTAQDLEDLLASLLRRAGVPVDPEHPGHR